MWLPALALVALWIPGADQGGFRVDTGLYAAISRYAYETGDLIHLHAGDQPYFNKPPLAFWIHGLFLHVFGVHLWAARLPTLIAAIGVALVTARMARALSGPRVATLTGVVLVTTLEFFRYTGAISLDLWQTLWLVSAVWLVAEGVKRGRGVGEWVVVMAGAPLGLALLTKPLIGLAMLPILAVWLVWIGRARMAVWLVLAGVVAVVIAGPWHLGMMRAYPGEFVRQYFFKQSLERATGEASDRAPWWTYLWNFARNYWPWLPALMAGVLVAAVRGPLERRESRGAGAERLCLLWIGVWLVALSIFADKAGRYALILYPATAWLASMWMARRGPRVVTIGLRALERWLGPALVAGAIVLPATGVRVSDPATPQWGELRAELERRGNPDIWASPESGMRWTTSNIYLDTGKWPRTARLDAGEAGAPGVHINPARSGDPRPGELMIFSEDSRLVPRDRDRVVWRSGRLMLIEVVAEWDGRLKVREAPPANEGRE